MEGSRGGRGGRASGLTPPVVGDRRRVGALDDIWCGSTWRRSRLLRVGGRGQRISNRAMLSFFFTCAKRDGGNALRDVYGQIL